MSLIVFYLYLLLNFILFGLCFSIFMICLFFIPFFQQYRIIYLYAFLSCFSEVIIPVWFFQGIEKMKYLTYIRTTSIVLYTILVFTFIKKEMDFTLLALLQSLANITAGVFSLILLLIFVESNLYFLLSEWWKKLFVIVHRFSFPEFYFYWIRI